MTSLGPFLIYDDIFIVAECLDISWNSRDTVIKMKVKAEKRMSFTSQLDNWAFTGKAIHRENRGDQRFQVSMPIMLNHCHKKRSLLMSGETGNGHGKWKLYGSFIAIKDSISSSVGHYSCI